ncbi:MAG: hypothetical protein AAF969_06505 [Bacteroidota bacterium]
MYKILQINTLLLMFSSLAIYGQKKIKAIKNPVAWTYAMKPISPLPEGVKTYSIDIVTDLDPMDFWDEARWSAQVQENDFEKKEMLRKEAVQDTLRKWGTNYMGLNRHPYVELYQNQDLKIKLTTDSFQLDNLQLDVDYSDPESILGELNITARLTVHTKHGEVLLDESLRYLIDDVEGQTTLFKVRHFMMNPSFKLKFKMTKKPEKKRKLLEKRIKRYQADILEHFVIESGKIIREHYLPQSHSAYAATFGIKNKGNEALNEASENAKLAINGLSALSKKRRKTWNEAETELKNAMNNWKDMLDRTSDPEAQKLLTANMALGYLLTEQLELCRQHLIQIPQYSDLASRGFLTGNFIYYLKGLDAALAVKEKYGTNATLLIR